MRRGDLQQAHLRLEGYVLADADAQAESWDWRFRLLRAEILLLQGQIQQALDLLGSSLPAEPRLEPLNPMHQLLRAAALTGLGEFAKAGDLLAKARHDALAAGREDLLARIAIAEGSLSFRLNQLDAADNSFREGFERARKLDDHYQQASAQNNRGLIRIRRYRFDEAVPFLQEALAASEKVDARLYMSVALGNLGLCYYRLGDFDNALRFRERAVEFQKQAGALSLLQNSLGEIGNIYMLQQEAEQAIPYYKQALELAQELDIPSAEARWAGNLAMAYANIEDWDAAEKLNDEAFRFRMEQTPDIQAHSLLNAAVIAAGRKDNVKAVEMFDAVIQSAVDNPATVWEAHAGLARLRFQAGEFDEARAHFETALGIIEQRRTGLLRNEFKITFLSQLIRFYQDYVDMLATEGDAERALQVAESSRARMLAERMGLDETAADGLSLAQYRQMAARSRTILLSYWLAPQRSFMWIITPSEARMFVLPGEDEIGSLVRQYQAMIENLRDPIQEGSGAGFRLSEILLQPVAGMIRPGSRLLLVPDGVLHNLNLETLPVGEPANARYWIHDVTISIAPALSVLAAGDPAERMPRPSLLLIGDPETADPQFPPLPHAGEEIDSIQRHFASWDQAAYTGAGASAESYLQSDPGRFSIIHFAAHAAANAEDPLESAVILSPSETGFKLYARDVLGQTLNADLVTISACHSAGTRTYSGEGLVGFAWAFLHAGARSVIAGLWDVNDRSTAQLMDGLYQQVRNRQDPDMALRESKLSLIRNGGNHAKPYYWAPFQVYIRTSPAPDPSAPGLSASRVELGNSE